jgi:hypothetical protein
VKQEEITIAVAYPDPGSVKSCYHQSIVNMMIYEFHKPGGELIPETRHLGTIVFQSPGCYVSINRSKHVDFFLHKTQDTHLLMIDPDIRFDHFILDSVVAHLLYLKDEPIDILAGRVNINNGYPVFYNNEFGGLVQQVQPFIGVKEFYSVGTGIIVLSRRMLQELIIQVGHGSLFLHQLISGREHGDDLSFCNLAREHNFKIYGAWHLTGEHLKENFVPSRYPETLNQVAPGFGNKK